jgi:hypothetical protein
MTIGTMITRTGAALGRSLNRLESWITILREGVVAGALGGGVVALWYLLCDSIGGRPFHTPAVLGAIFFEGLRGHDIAAATLAPVVSYTAIHFAAFIVFGIASAIVIAIAELEPLFILGALMLYACFEICFLAGVIAIDASALGVIGSWKIVIANVMTLATVFGYFEYRHPQLLSRFKARWATFDEETIVSAPVLPDSIIPVPELRLAPAPAVVK